MVVIRQAGHCVGDYHSSADSRAAAVVAVLEPAGRQTVLEVVHHVKGYQANVVDVNCAGGADRQRKRIGLHLGQRQSIVGRARRLVGIVAEKRAPRDVDVTPAAAVVDELIGEALGGVAGQVWVQVVAEDNAEGRAAVQSLEPECHAVIGRPVFAAQIASGAGAPARAGIVDLQNVVVGCRTWHCVGRYNIGGDCRATAVVAILEPASRQAILEIIDDGERLNGARAGLIVGSSSADGQRQQEHTCDHYGQRNEGRPSLMHLETP